MSSRLVVVTLALGIFAAPAVHAAPPVAPLAPEDDDPGFAPARAPAATAASPAGTMDDDPGFSTGDDDELFGHAAPAPRAVRVAPAPHRPALLEDDGDDVSGMSLRLSYRTFRLAEISNASLMPTDQRFHSIGLDVYPISWYIRVGLSTNVAFENEGNGDWLATEGLTAGFQRPAHRFTPWIEGGMHVGVGKRNFWNPERLVSVDSMTMMWVFGGEVGVDMRIGGSTQGSLSLGLLRTSYFYTRGDPKDPINTFHDNAFSLKVGLGW